MVLRHMFAPGNFTNLNHKVRQMVHPSRRSFLAATAATVWAANSSVAGFRADDRIIVGQIGTRHAHASGKMDTVRRYPEIFNVVGVVEPDERRQDQIAASSSYKDLPLMTQQQLLNMPGLQLVLVETEIDRLLPTAELCINAGNHIHMDKPAGTSLLMFKKICAIANQQQLAIQMGYMFRSNAAFRFMQKAVRENWLGEVFSIHCEMSKKVGDIERRELARYPGGAMFELGCHLIDAVVGVLGKPSSVSAFNRKTRPDHDSLMDNCLAVLQYETAVATVKSAVCEVQGQQRRQFVICGTKGTISIQPLEPATLSLTLGQPAGGFRKGTQQVELKKTAGRYDGDLLHLARVIRKEEPLEYDTAHDIAVQETVLQASGING